MFIFLGDKVNNHAIHETLKNIASVLNEFDNLPKDILSSSIIERDYVKQISSEVQRRLDNIDPALISIQVLNNLNNSFVSILAELKAFLKNKTKVNLSNAITHVTSILNHLTSIPVPTNVADVAAMSEAINMFHDTIGQKLRTVEELFSKEMRRLHDIEALNKALEQRIDAQIQRVDSVVLDAQKSFSAAEDQRQKEFRKTSDERSKQETKDSQQRNKDWEQFLSSKINEVQALTTDAKTEMTILGNSIRDQASDLINQIESAKVTAEQLVGIISNVAIIGGYQKEADWEKVEASKWKRSAVLSLIGLVLFAIAVFGMTYFESHQTAVNWPLFSIRIFVTLSFGAVSAYAALQGERHEKAQRKYRKMELELASISPFLHDLPDTEKQKMKMDLANKLFGQTDTIRPEPDGKTTGTAFDIVKMALETVTNAIKK